MTNLPASMLDPKTPPDVEIRFEARKPVTDPTLGIPVSVSKIGTPRNRLVAIGDSITQGYQSGAVFNPQISYPAIIAREMGWKELLYPTYHGPEDGLPVNLERLANDLQQRFGARINWLKFIPSLLYLYQHLKVLENYWERGKGSVYVKSAGEKILESSSGEASPDRLSSRELYPQQGKINDNLAVYGWDLRKTLARNADICIDVLKKNPPKNSFFRLIVDHHNERAAIRVLNSARDVDGKALTPLQAAAALAREGTQEDSDGDGIETLIVVLGANNALRSVLSFNVVWSDHDYNDMDLNNKYTVWRPIHFQAELDRVVSEVKKIRARHVIFGTVPHISIVPFARGVGGKVKKGSRYYPYYTLPWISDKDFNPNKHPNLTHQQVRAVDSAIDQYNDYITAAVQQARTEGRDWYLFESSGLLDRFASRRYLDDPSARPSWWEEVGGTYKLPPELQALSPVPDSRFFISEAIGRTQGGLFSLDGIHPTTIGYGIIAQEIIKIMQLAGVKFYESDGSERTGEVKLDFQRLIAEDTLISSPPHNVASILNIIGAIDKHFNLLSHFLKRS